MGRNYVDAVEATTVFGGFGDDPSYRLRASTILHQPVQYCLTAFDSGNVIS
jgi:hypothetical protein